MRLTEVRRKDKAPLTAVHTRAHSDRSVVPRTGGVGGADGEATSARADAWTSNARGYKSAVADTAPAPSDEVYGRLEAATQGTHQALWWLAAAERHGSSVQGAHSSTGARPEGPT